MTKKISGGEGGSCVSMGVGEECGEIVQAEGISSAKVLRQGPGWMLEGQ